MTVPSMGAQSTFSFNAVNMVGWCTVGLTNTHLEREGMRGVRSHDVDDVRLGTTAVSGQIVMSPTDTELDTIEPYIIGAGGTVDATLSGVTIVVDKGQRVRTYTGCKVNRATYRGSSGGLLEVILDIEGLTGSTVGSAPGEPATLTPFVFSDTTLTLAGSAREVEGFEMVIDNALVTDRYQNSTTRTDLPEQDRIVTLQTTHAYSSNTSGLQGQALAGATGTLALNDGTNSRTYTFGKLQVEEQPIPVQGKGPIPLVINMTARKDGATKEIAVT